MVLHRTKWADLVISDAAPPRSLPSTSIVIVHASGKESEHCVHMVDANEGDLILEVLNPGIDWSSSHTPFVLSLQRK